MCIQNNVKYFCHRWWGIKLKVHKTQNNCFQQIYSDSWHSLVILLHIITTHQRSCGKVVFSVLSVCLSFHMGEGNPCRGAQLSPWDTFKLVHYEPRPVRKQGVGNRLKCLLVVYCLFGSSSYCFRVLRRYYCSML